MSTPFEPIDDDWECPHCGSGEPHHAIEVMDGELEVDVTCQGVYIIPDDGGRGFFFDHDEFERVIEHYEERPDYGLAEEGG